MLRKLIKIFLRLSISAGFLSAIADRFGWWEASISVWGNWNNFLDYTQLINSWFSRKIITIVGVIATGAEIIFAFFLLFSRKRQSGEIVGNL